MMVSSLSLTYLQVSATAGATASRPTAGGAPSPAPQSVAQDDCRCHHDKPRRSPFVHALKEALRELATSLRAGDASATDEPADTAVSAASTAAAAETGAAGEPIDLEHALMDFARALMQALRGQGGERRERVDGDHRGHHRHHHHGRRSWGDPAQRVDALAQQIQAGAPAASASSTAAAAADDAAVPAATGASLVAAGATVEGDAGTAATPNQGTAVYVTAVNVPVNAEAAASASPFAGLLEAFARLQKALGKADGDDTALPKALSEFLQTLAAKLRGEDLPTAEAATEPGALIDVAA
jgi:hypothetical protein